MLHLLPHVCIIVFCHPYCPFSKFLHVSVVVPQRLLLLCMWLLIQFSWLLCLVSGRWFVVSGRGFLSFLPPRPPYIVQLHTKFFVSGLGFFIILAAKITFFCTATHTFLVLALRPWFFYYSCRRDCLFNAFIFVVFPFFSCSLFHHLVVPSKTYLIS